MRRLTAAVGLGVLVAGAALYAAQDMPEMAKPQKEHDWLKQLAGEWESESEITMDPSKPPTKVKGTETTRLIGGFWAVSENKGELFGQPFTGILTLGYDVDKKKYAGTWIDSVTSILWVFNGSVDEAGKTLTWEVQGPGPEGKPVMFREWIELKDKDTKVLTSTTQQDGKWVPHLKVTYTRKKK